MKKYFLLNIILITLFCNPNRSYAWVYPEHRDIALIAIQNLSPEYRRVLDELWTEARKGYEFRLTEAVIDATQSTKPTQLDFASWPAIAGDHSCSAENMVYNILETEWILKVADVTAQLKIDIANAKDRSDRINALRNSDIKLQSADPEYATRAGSNNVHFLLPLKEASTQLEEYIFQCLAEGTELNALGVYSWYHYRAIAKISRLTKEKLTSGERSKLILSALADEAFALHFLEDVYASGHVAGTRGDASQRKGTHDYYNEMGLRVSTWEGESIVLTGDAWMRPEDGERAAIAVQKSLEDFLNAVNGKINYVINDNVINSFLPEDFNVCSGEFMSGNIADSEFKNSLKEIFIKTPVPGLAEGLGEFPRFRAELGSFVGFAPALRGALLDGGFGLDQTALNAVGGIEVSGRFGLGLDGVLNESGDGLVFLEVGWRQDGSSTLGIVNDPETQSYGNLLAAIPGRSAFSGRIRMPFYVIPGDLLIAGPFLFLIDQEALASMAVTAVNGGLIPWQSAIATSIGRFQFVLGREVGVYYFGRTKDRDAMFNYSPDENGDPQISIISYRSTQIEFPILEYRPFRSFGVDQRSSLFLQIYGGVDIPHNVELLSATSTNGTIPELKNVWYLGARLIFDWRHYF